MTSNKTNQITLDRNGLYKQHVDSGNRTIIIGFNEPRFKKSSKDSVVGDIDSKLNARFASYFLPAVEIARMQKTRPRLFIASGLTMALKWNAEDDEQKKIMIANNAIKLDFLNKLFDIFFANDFSLVEYIVPQDTLKVPDDKFLSLWKPIERKYPKEIVEIRFQLTKFLYPKQFNAKNYEALTDLQKEKLTEVDATDAFKYAIGHLFALGDINFEGNYIHGPYGYASIGGEAETFFNSVRDLSSDLLKDFGELLFDREVIVFQNYRIVLKNKYKVPPPYNGMFRDKEYLEVTYENNKDLSFYDEQEKLKDQMQYVYDHLISRDDYQQFWRSYRNRYFNLKARYKEAYAINPDW